MALAARGKRPPEEVPSSWLEFFNLLLKRATDSWSSTFRHVVLMIPVLAAMVWIASYMGHMSLAGSTMLLAGGALVFRAAAYSASRRALRGGRRPGNGASDHGDHKDGGSKDDG